MITRVGTSGWGRADWVGPFYPVHLRERPEAWLAHYATRFRTVEITSSFHAFPDEALVTEWARVGATLQQQAPFEFSLKAPRAATHVALPAGDAAALREILGRFDREVLDPLDGEGLLGAVLLQLPPSLEASEEAARLLQRGLDALVERRVAIEFRHPSWAARGCVAPAAEPLFASRDVCLVETDAPGAPRVVPPIDARHAYLRLHGRRHEAWRAGGPQDGERYDYLYRRDELADAAARMRQLRDAGREARAYFNNAPQAKSVANAVDLLEMIGQPAIAPRPRLTQQRKLF